MLYCGNIFPGKFKAIVWYFAFFNTSDVDFASLKLILTHVMNFSIPFSSHLAPITDIVISSIYARIGGCLRPDLVVGPLHSTSAAFISIFLAKAKSVAEIGTNSYYSLFQFMPCWFGIPWYRSHLKIVVIIHNELGNFSVWEPLQPYYAGLTCMHF